MIPKFDSQRLNVFVKRKIFFGISKRMISVSVAFTPMKNSHVKKLVF